MTRLRTFLDIDADRIGVIRGGRRAGWSRERYLGRNRRRDTRLHRERLRRGEIQSVAGNNVGYGATGGTIFIGGCAGHRLGIRNTGSTIVAEAAGKYACEYMTRGRVLILGPVENEIGSGMTGGELFIFDPETEVPAKLHGKSVTVIECSHVDCEWMHPLLHQFFCA